MENNCWRDAWFLYSAKLILSSKITEREAEIIMKEVEIYSTKHNINQGMEEINE